MSAVHLRRIDLAHSIVVVPLDGTNSAAERFGAGSLINEEAFVPFSVDRLHESSCWSKTIWRDSWLINLKPERRRSRLTRRSLRTLRSPSIVTSLTRR
jgi:hypothetical protein